MHQRGSSCEVGLGEGGGVPVQNLAYDLKKMTALNFFLHLFLEKKTILSTFSIVHIPKLYLEFQSINVEALLCRGASLYVYENPVFARTGNST